MNRLYDVNIHVKNRTKFTPAALSLIENNISDVVVTTSEEEFADSIAEDIRSLNNGWIDGIDIRLTCLEDLPYTEFSYNEKAQDAQL